MSYKIKNKHEIILPNGIPTYIRETENGHQLGFTIGNQTFFLQEKLPEEDMTSLDYAKWYQRQLGIALEKLMNINKFIESIDNNLYNKIRNSKGDAECRRLLKEHLTDKLDSIGVDEKISEACYRCNGVGQVMNDNNTKMVNCRYCT